MFAENKVQVGFLAVAGALALGVLAACVAGAETDPEERYGDLIGSSSGGGGNLVLDRGATSAQASLLTKDASELVRLREEHSTLIASSPAGREVGPTSVEFDPQGRASEVLAGVDSYSERSLAPNPLDGVYWYRDSGGDWSPPRMREVNPYGRLFYATGQLPDHPSFYDETIYVDIASRIAGELARVMPVVGEKAFRLGLDENLGWELASPKEPAIYVWSRFEFQGPEDDRALDYVVGGVLRLGVRDFLDGDGNLVYQYLVPADFVGPVLVERVR